MHVPGTSLAKNPGSHLSICCPYLVALLSILRSTYPLPSLSGTAPSARANVRVRAWSATALYAVSLSVTSSVPTSPPYDPTGLIPDMASKRGAKTSMS